MTDFYALLKQSILDRGIRDPDDRQEVYAQARRAVIKQLWDFRPPLAADEIDMRVGAYDTAVERIEVELRQVFAKAPVTNGAAARPKAAPARRPAPEPARTAAYANGRGQSTALAEWAREQPDYAPGVQRAVTAYVPPETEAANDDYTEDEIAEYEEEAEYEDAPEEEPPRRGSHQRPRIDRWSATAARQAVPIRFELSDWFGWLGTGEEIKIRLLAIAVGALFVLLVGVGAFILGARTGSNQAAAPGGDVRTEVSDAATAARIPNDKVAVLASYALFDGRDPRVFATTPDNPVYFDDAEGFARITSSTTASGVKAIIGPGLAARLAGQNVRVVITARASLEGGAAGMRFAYQSGLAISHWQTANLSSDYTQLGMEWRVPTMRTNPAGDALIVEPGIPGDGTGVDIKSIRIDVLAS